MLALRPPVVSPRLSQPDQWGGHTLWVARANQLQLLTLEVGRQLQVCRPAGSWPSPAAWGRQLYQGWGNFPFLPAEAGHVQHSPRAAPSGCHLHLYPTSAALPHWQLFQFLCLWPC